MSSSPRRDLMQASSRPPAELPAALTSLSNGRGDFAGDHHFSGFDDRQRIVASTELQFSHGVRGDDRSQGLVADTQPHLSEKAVASYFVDEAPQLIPPAERNDQTSWRRTRLG